MTVSRKNFERITRMAPAINWFARRIQIPVLGKLLVEPWFFGFRDTNKSRGRVVSLNIEVPVGPSQILPHDLLIKLMKRASHRVFFHECFCRAGMNCKKYPHDFGCLMIGKSTQGMVENGLGREVTAEEAEVIIRRAKDLGLIHMVMWVKAEANLLANRRSENYQMLEICQCCPCCCLALRNLKQLKGASRERFKGIGFLARLGDGCTGCGDCVSICPMGNLSMVDGSVQMGENCIGCGLCAYHCPQRVIEMVPGGKDAVGDDLLEYFEGINIS